MHTTKDLCEQLGVTRTTLENMVDAGTFPAPLKIGRGNRWRVEDVQRWFDYLQACRDYRTLYGLDPHAPESPVAPPVYSHGRLAFDPRACNARLAEAERERRSRVLAKARTTAERDAVGATLFVSDPGEPYTPDVECSRVFYAHENIDDIVKEMQG